MVFWYSNYVPIKSEFTFFKIQFNWMSTLQGLHLNQYKGCRKVKKFGGCAIRPWALSRTTTSLNLGKFWGGSIPPVPSALYLTVRNAQSISSFDHAGVLGLQERYFQNPNYIQFSHIMKKFTFFEQTTTTILSQKFSMILKISPKIYVIFKFHKGASINDVRI